MCLSGYKCGERLSKENKKRRPCGGETRTIFRAKGEPRNREADHSTKGRRSRVFSLWGDVCMSTIRSGGKRVILLCTAGSPSSSKDASRVLYPTSARGAELMTRCRRLHLHVLPNAREAMGHWDTKWHLVTNVAGISSKNSLQICSLSSKFAGR
jgi:hypothetical protein